MKINNIINENHSFINFYNKNEVINTKTLYLIPLLDTRKNPDNLGFYKTLHEKKIIKNNMFISFLCNCKNKFHFFKKKI